MLAWENLKSLGMEGRPTLALQRDCAFPHYSMTTSQVGKSPFSTTACHSACSLKSFFMVFKTLVNVFSNYN